MNKNKNKIYVLIASNYNNLGDLLINRLLIEELTKFGKVYVDALGVPKKFKEFLFVNDSVINVEEHYNGSLKSFNKKNIALKIGGDNFTHFFTSPGPTKIGFSTKTVASLMLYAYLKSKKVAIYGLGKDINVANKFVWIIYRKIYNQIFVRSYENYKLLSNDSDKVKYAPDLAFINKFKPKTKVENKSFCVSMRGGDLEVNTNTIVRIIEYFLSQDYKVKIFYQVEEDYLANKQLYDSLDNSNVEFFENCIWYDGINFYEGNSIVLSNRLHVLLLGMMHGLTPLAFLNDRHYSDKIERIYKSIEMSQFILRDGESFNLDELNQLIDDDLRDSYVAKTYIKTHNLCESRIGQIFSETE